MTQPPPPHRPAPGYTWTADIDDGDFPLDPADVGSRRCGHGVDETSTVIGAGRSGDLVPFSTRPHNPCNARPVAVIGGQPRCGNHLDGKWIAYGCVWTWTYQSTGEKAA